MNDLLQLSGEFYTKKASSPTHATIPSRNRVRAEKMRGLAVSLQDVLEGWPEDSPTKDVLVSVTYNRVIAKSNRVKRLLAIASNDPEASICGARYEERADGTRVHVITHYVPKAWIERSIRELKLAADLVEEHFDGEITGKRLDSLWDKTTGNNNESWKKRTGGEPSRSNFARLVHDAYYVDSFSIPMPQKKDGSHLLTTIYKTDGTAFEMLGKLGIRVDRSSTLEYSAVLNQDQYQQLFDRAPYLIAMSTMNLSEFPPLPEIESVVPSHSVYLESPTTEPIIGVIDTPFEEKHPPYFHEWVTPIFSMPRDIPLDQKDYDHGTSVSSLIVNGPGMNPRLEDGCGHFRVRHFGVAPLSGMNSFVIARTIERIVHENPDILVWNLSLGSAEETERFSISPEAEVLDRLQRERDILFVVAGTNQDSTHKATRIGAPADSVNSLVVNSVRLDGSPASYTRKGPVLDFYRKPDVAYYGGDQGQPLSTCCGTGERRTCGTSLAAPLVARKAAFLMYKMGLSRDLAKALIIDSACGWSNGPISAKVGYGVVPIHINDVLRVPNHEIRFCVTGVAGGYETYNYSIPVPHIEGGFPYLARALLCYSPKCNRNQGVDYTSTELDLHIGRLKDGSISSIKANTQGEPGDRTSEREARDFLGKWDNVKRVCDKVTAHPRTRKMYQSPMWGIKIRKTSRMSLGDQGPQPFGLVVTLSEINHRNRIDAFVQQCIVNEWRVHSLDIDTYVSIYNSSQVEIAFE